MVYCCVRYCGVLTYLFLCTVLRCTYVLIFMYCKNVMCGNNIFIAAHTLPLPIILKKCNRIFYICLGWFQSHSGPAGRDRGDRRDSGSAGGRRHRYFCCPVPGTRRTMVDGACGYSRVRGFVIFTSSIFWRKIM